MIKNIKNSYKIFVILAIFLALIFPNIILALGPETKDASGITKEQAYLNGYYYDTNGGVFGSNKTEYVNFAYSKNATTECTDLYLNGNKTTLLEVKPIKSSYSSLVARLENETDYYFCFILYELNYGGIGGNKKYKPVAYGNVLSFKTLKGFVSKPTKTPTSGITKRTVGPDKIGNVSTYEASRTTDIEALFSGDVDRLDGEAHAYFRYAILDKPPIFCNDIYGSAQRSAVAINPNVYGKLSTAGSFSTVVSNLSPDTTYYYCAIVSNNAINPTEIEYGPVKSFRTLPCQTCPQTTITTNNPYNIGSNSATLNGAFSTIPQVDTYFEYKKESDIEWKKTPSESHAQRSYGKFNTLITSLTKATVYQFRAVGEATTVGKTGGSAPTSKIFYGDTISFKTTSGNLFDSFGWTQEPFDDSTGGDDYDEVDEDQNDGTDGTCFDGIKNGDETGIDTGGRCGKKGPNPDNPFDCEPNCDIVIPPLPTCFDGIQNGNETGIDTGGWCGDGSNGTCFDGIKNGDETGIDTGGRCYIPPLPTCFDGIKNGNETGIDTGGWCGNGTPGNGNCFDGIKNGDETGIDTGGRCYIKNPGGNVIVIGPGGTVKNNGGTTISSGGTTIISGGNTTTKGGTTTISGGTTSINGQNTNINNGIATNTGGTATTNGGTTTLRGGTTTITFKDANGNTQTFITNSEVKISRNGDTSVVTFKDANGNTQTVVIRDGEGQVVNVGGVSTTENGSTVLNGGNTNVLDNRSGPKLGDRLTPPSDAIVRYHEGIETVFTRQIMKNLSFARLYGYSDGDNLQNFADTLSHTFAKEYFGYIDATGLEVRVSKPDVSAYELRQIGGVLTVYEYYENVIVDIRNTTTIFKNKNPYEYYDRRRR